MRTVIIEARHFGLIIRAFNMIEGSRSLSLSYKLGRILAPVSMLQQAFLARLKPYVGPGGHLKENLTPEQELEAQSLVEEEMEIEIPSLSITEFLAHPGLTVKDDTVLPYLVDIGILVEENAQGD